MTSILERTIRRLLREGGLKLKPDDRVDLTPQLVKQACRVYEDLLSKWNAWLAQRGKEPVVPIKPSGSSSYAERDHEEGVDAIYGDVDYLVQFPSEKSDVTFAERRKSNAAVEREYTKLLGEFLNSVKPPQVDVETTMKVNGIPTQIVLRLPGGQSVQVDTVITFAENSSWMKGRYTPERGVKGYVTGNLYKALGEYLTLTIGTEGVIARTKDGIRVSSKQRAGVDYQKVSGDFSTFLIDIAMYILGPDARIGSALQQLPGLDAENVSVETLAQGIVALQDTLEKNDPGTYGTMLRDVLETFGNELESTVDAKSKRGLDGDKEIKLRKHNVEQLERVASIFAGSI